MTETTSLIPARKDVPEQDTWSLHKLFTDVAAWEEGLTSFSNRMSGVDAFKGTLNQSAERLCELLDFIHDLGRLEERLGYYAHLRVNEDVGHSEAQGRMARYASVATQYAARSSYITPEIQAIPDADIHAWLDTDTLAPYRIYLNNLLRYKPHVLSEAEERLLAMQSEFAQTARQGFNALTDVDMQFGELDTPDGSRPLTHSTYAIFMQSQVRSLREAAYRQLLQEFKDHRHTLTALYNGSVQRDVYMARVRNFPSAREMSLFSDDVPVQVYDQLIDSVHKHLPALHRYYDVRRRALNLDRLHLFDTRVSLVPEVKTHYTYDQAVDATVASLEPLGQEYTQALREGLLGRWVDRYENKGKRSGAFSAGSFDGDPYILMNYKEDVLGDVFTLTHEAGHSMHTWYSARHQPFQHYNYTIFVAEVASTFNEHLLARHLKQQTDDPALQAYLVNKEVDDMIATLFRQAMFAEFEKIAHEMVERNEPLTIDSVTQVYGDLLRAYFGPDIPLEETSPLEALRIPHFYSAFYVYKYATGMAASIALSDRVLDGGDAEREQYLSFLKSGGSKFPLEQLRDAGVDMTQPEPIDHALNRFGTLVTELEEALARI